MTIIVYRDGVMAADTASFVCGGDVRIPGATKKIHRLADGGIFGGAGKSFALQTVREWLNGDRKGTIPAGNDATAVWVRPDDSVAVIDGDYVEEFKGPFFAVGSGAAAALGAMYAGATATEAVRIAGMVDPFCGGEITVLRHGRVP
jgi:ATP-dependent protease HslVU (ClpYQ) peptidase subunit